MSDTKQLEALRDAAADMKHVAIGASANAYLCVEVACDRAIAALSPASAKACSGFVCDGWIDAQGMRRRQTEGGAHSHIAYGSGSECTCTCGQPFSAHQQEQPQQPAPSALPELVARYWCHDGMTTDNRAWDSQGRDAFCRLSDAQAYQRECERLRGENALLRDDGNAAVHEAAVWMDNYHAAEQRAEQAEALRDMMVEKCSDAAVARERLEDKLSQAERELDEARIELAALRGRIERLIRAAALDGLLLEMCRDLLTDVVPDGPAMGLRWDHFEGKLRGAWVDEKDAVLAEIAARLEDKK